VKNKKKPNRPKVFCFYQERGKNKRPKSGRLHKRSFFVCFKGWTPKKKKNKGPQKKRKSRIKKIFVLLKKNWPKKNPHKVFWCSTPSPKPKTKKKTMFFPPPPKRFVEGEPPGWKTNTRTPPTTGGPPPKTPLKKKTPKAKGCFVSKEPKTSPPPRRDTKRKKKINPQPTFGCFFLGWDQEKRGPIDQLKKAKVVTPKLVGWFPNRKKGGGGGVCLPKTYG